MKTNSFYFFIVFFFLSQNIFAVNRNSLRDTTTANSNIRALSNIVIPITRYGISPYLNLALTSLKSILEKGDKTRNVNNGTIKDLLGNYYVFGILSFLTLFLLVAHFMKFIKPINKLLHYFENQSSVVFMTFYLLYTYINMYENVDIPNNLSFAGFIIPLIAMVMTMICLINFYVIIVVRFFFEILISMTHLPFLSTIFEVGKIILSLLILFLSFVFPTITLILCLIIFIFSVIIFNKARRETKYYVSIYISHFFTILFNINKPVINPFIFEKFKDEYSNIQIALFCFPMKKIYKIKKKSKAILIMANENLFLISQRFLRKNKVFEIIPSESGVLILKRCIHFIQIYSINKKINLIVSNDYKGYSEYIAEAAGMKLEESILYKNYNNTKNVIFSKTHFLFAEASKLFSHKPENLEL